MSEDTLHAATQYGDVQGAVSLDGWSMPPLSDIAKALGVDTERYWPINIHFYASPPLGARTFTHVSVDVVDKLLFGDNFDDLRCYVSERQGKVQTIRFTRTNVNLVELLKPIKRLSIAVRRKELDLQELDAVDEIDLTEAESGR